MLSYMKYIWRLINVGFGIEATRGTAVAVSNWLPKTDLSFDEKNEVIQDESSLGIITDSNDSFSVKRWAEGEIGGNIQANSIGYLFYSLLWAVTSVVDTTWAYKHTFNLANTNQSPSLTLWVNDPVLSNLQFSLTMIDSMTINAEEGQQATFTVTLKSKPSATTTHTVSYDIDHKLLARHSVFKIANNLAWLDAASVICLKSFEITFNKNLEDDYCMWSLTPIDFINKQFSIEGSFTANFTDNTFRTIQLDWTKKAVRFSLIDTANTIGLTSKPEVTIDLALASFTEFSRSQGNDEVVTQTLTFKGIYSQVDDETVIINVVNTTADYTA